MDLTKSGPRAAAGALEWSPRFARVQPAWDTPGEFEKVHVSDWGSVTWDQEGNLELCPDSLYPKLTQGLVSATGTGQVACHARGCVKPTICAV